MYPTTLSVFGTPIHEAALPGTQEGLPTLGQDHANFAEPDKAKFRERSFHALERVRASRRPGFYALRMTEKRRVTLEPKRRLGYAALGIMERRFKGHDFFVGDRYSIAGNALHGYTHT
jgi:glutathione S-transferase